MRTVTGLILIACMSCFFSFTLISNPIKPFHLYHHERWTMEDGLPMNSVFEITQTPDGYIWLGTASGLTRFDGIKFEEIDWESTPSEISSIVISLHTDRSGALWIGTRGNGLIRYYDGEFTRFGLKDGLSGREIWSLAESMDGTIWIGTLNGLDVHRDGKITSIPLPDRLRNREIRSLMVDKRGRIWIGTNGGGLGIATKIGFRFDVRFIGLAGERINVIFQDKKENIWIGTKGSGLIQVKGKEFTHYTTENNLPSNFVRCLHEDPSGNLWLGTKNGGICIYDPEQKRFTSADDGGELENRCIYDFFEDREKTLWFGTQGGGLNSLRNTPIMTYTKKNGLSSNYLFGVFQDSRGKLWVGTKGYGSNCIDLETNKIRVYTKKDGLSSNSCTSFAETPEGSLWLGSSGGGINRMRLSDGKIECFDDRNGLIDKFIRAVYVDRNGLLWVGTDFGGLHYFKDDKFIVFKRLKYRINVIHVDQKGYLWAGTFGGGMYRFKDGKVEVFDRKRGLASNYISCIHEDNDGALWFASTGFGLTRYLNGDFLTVSKRNGLPNNALHAILQDNKENLWMSSNRGIFYIDQDDVRQFAAGHVNRLHFFQFGIEDGMKSLETNGGAKPSGWKDRAGKLWFPSTRGLSVVDPENLQPNIPPPPVKIEHILLKRQNERIHDRHSLTLPPEKRNLEIHYTALSFIGSRKINFRYKMEGWDEDWLDTGTRRFAVYNNLPPGKYRFMVTARHRDGAWNHKVATLELKLSARFYETLWFQFFFPAFLLLALYFSYYRIRKYRAARRLERKYKKTCTTPEESRHFLDKIIRHIESKKVYRSPDISLNSLADTLEVNPRKISLVFNEHLHKNFYEVMNHYRVEEAKTLLRDSSDAGKSILEICYEVGFNHKSSFNRVFKGVTGMTPTEFRKKGEDNPRGRFPN